MYIPTVQSSIGWYNSGELVSAAITLDVPHSPGYPLFTRLANFSLNLPTGLEPAYNVNLLTTFLGIFGACLLAFYLNFAGYSTFSSISASILLLSCSIYWQQSVLAEVYTLEICFIILGLIIGKFIERGNESSQLAFVAGLVGMLGVGHRPTFGLYTISLIFFLLHKKNKFQNIKKFLFWMIAGLIVGCLPSVDLYLRLQSYNRVLLDPLIGRGIVGFFKVFTGTVYKSGLFAFNIVEIIARFKALLLLFCSQGTIAIVIVPVIVIIKNKGKLSSDIKAILWILAVNIFFVINYNAFQAETMLLPAITSLCLICGIAFDYVKNKKWGKPLIILFLMYLAFNSFFAVYENKDNLEPIKYVKRMATILPRGSVLMLSNDVEFRPFWYLRQTRKFRNDIAVQLVDDIAPKDLQSLSQYAKTKRLFGSLVYPDDAKSKLIASYSLQSMGYVCNVASEDNIQEDKWPELEKLNRFQLSEMSYVDLFPNVSHISTHNNPNEINPGDILFYQYSFNGIAKDLANVVVIALLINDKGDVLQQNNILVGHDVHQPINYNKHVSFSKESIIDQNLSSLVIPYDIQSGKYKIVFSCGLSNKGIPDKWLDLHDSVINTFNYYGYLEVFSLKYGLSYRPIIKNIQMSEMLKTDGLNLFPFITINEINIKK